MSEFQALEGCYAVGSSRGRYLKTLPKEDLKESLLALIPYKRIFQFSFVTKI